MFPSPLTPLSDTSITPFRLGLTGWPLEHSLSPALHEAALRATSLPGDYRLFPVPPLPGGAPALGTLIASLRRGELHGLNVTIPHKMAVLNYLDGLTPTAQAAGAANTIFLRDGRLIGDNTDIQGFLSDLEAVAVQGQQALVLGAGGAARGVVYGLAQAGWQVHVAARRLEQAQELVAELQNPSRSRGGQPLLQLHPHRLNHGDLAGLLPTLTLIVNATPLGTHPQVEATPWPIGLPFPLGVIVYDLVYNPPETAFLRQARLAGLHAFNGLGMLIGQAALSFEIWTGQTAPRQAMRQAAQEALNPL